MMGTYPQRELIERIRREKFGIGTATCNPLAKMLHEAIVHLSAELYQKDIHFISELLQNAEDNNYKDGVSPSLELVLTSADIAKVGATSTLVLFNNEVGFQPQHVEALCAVGLSTKKGKRDSGYIGEKGIGFKSVFLVTRTPYVISNGYRFRFTDEASTSEAKLGYVVPEWVDVPTDTDLRRVYGKQQLPQTMIVLPLRPDKVVPVREQLKQVSPETLLFLSKLRQLVVREDSKSSLCITRTDISPALNDLQGNTNCKAATVKLALGSNVSHTSEECTYRMLQQQFSVTARVEQRKEVDVWNITIAFPVRERINPGRFTGDIYAFLPSYLTSGFPFVVNADFLLVASRETLKFDSPWNIGILSCVPTVFRTAFKLFLSHSDTVREAYRYIPVQQPQNAEFRKVQQRILDDLKEEACVLVDSSVGYRRHDLLFCTPDMGRLIRHPEFSKILQDSASSGYVNPAIENPRWYVVDSAVQGSYRPAMEALGVPYMQNTEYIQFLEQEGWLLNLSELLYWDVICFVYNCGLLSVPVLKYCKQDGSVGLASFEEAKSDDGVKIYLSPAERGEWLSEWTSVFKPWVSVQFMPATTVQTLKELKRKSNRKICSLWDSLVSAVPDLSVRSYVRQLLTLMASATDTKFVLLTTEFIYQCTQGKDVQLHEVAYPLTFPVVDQSARITSINRQYPVFSILLPAPGSLWPKLQLNSWSNQIVVMSDDYLKPVSTWNPRLKVSISDKKEPLELQSFRSFLKSVMSAVDIPYFVPPTAPVYQMPKHLVPNMTIELVQLLLQWLTTCCVTGSYTRGSSFFQKLNEIQWIPTEAHGWRRPSSCFERSSFGAFFQESDLPCVPHSLIAYRTTLEELGLVTDVKNGCYAVVNYMLEISKDAQDSCDLAKATRLFEYLQKFGWAQVAGSAEKLKIFAPSMAGNSTSTWKESDACVIRSDDGFFDNSLTVLENVYPKRLLTFFAKVLGVPQRATVERFCELWLKWRTDVHEITAEECTRVWRILSEKWDKCDAQVWKNFVAKAWVPSVCEETGAFQLSSPSSIFIPDDLDLRSLFDRRPDVKFVWYPDRTEKMERALNKVYAAMAVKKLSECVQPKFIVGASSTEHDFGQNHQEISGTRILCGGLFRAILGFMAVKKYGLSSSDRQDLLSSLKGVEEISITKPITRSYTISCLTPSARAAQENVVAFWSKAERKFYRVDSDDPILLNSLARRHYRIQLATAISHGILSEHPLIAEDLVEFLAGLVAVRFESSHVEYELVRKNAKLYEEDESFLSELNLPEFLEDESQCEDI